MYLADIDLVFILVIAFLLLPVVGFGRLVWRVWYRNEQMESGGSFGRQLFRRK